MLVLRVFAVGIAMIGYLCFIAASILFIIDASIEIHLGPSYSPSAIYRSLEITAISLFLAGACLLFFVAIAEVITEPLHPGNISLLALVVAIAAFIVGLVAVSLSFYSGELGAAILGLITGSLLIATSFLKLTQHEFETRTGGIRGAYVRYMDTLEGMFFLTASILLVVAFALDIAENEVFPRESSILLLLAAIFFLSGSTAKLTALPLSV